MSLKSLLFFFIFFLPLIVFPQLVNKEINPMNVLFIGNSYTHYNSMPFIFQKIATSKNIKINVEMNAKSNHTFKMHSQRLDMYDVIRSKKWDYVVLQGFSRELKYDKEQIDTTSLPYIKQILDSIYIRNSCANVLLFMTWGYENGYTELDSSATSTYAEMHQSIENGYQYISNQFEIPIVPVGSVWNAFRQIYPNIKLYQEDQQHPNINGSYIAATSFYSSIFKASSENSYIPQMDSVIAKKIQQLSFAEVSKNLDTFKLNQNTIKVDTELTKKGEYLASGFSNFIYADSLEWDLGNGVKFNKPDFKYIYQKAGTYFIKLTVYDLCGTREIYRKVVFKAFIKPKKLIKKPKN
jgi:hypothetical protein